MRKVAALVLAVTLCCIASLAQTCPPPSQGGPNPSYAAAWTSEVASSRAAQKLMIESDGVTAVIWLSGYFPHGVSTVPWVAGDLIGIADADLASYQVDGFLVLTVNSVGFNLHGGESTATIVVTLPWATTPTNGYMADSGPLYRVPDPSNPGFAPVEVDITVDGQTTGNVSCMQSAEPTPHTFGASVQPTGGTLVSGSQAEPLTYSTQTFPLTTSLLVRSQQMTLSETVECPAMGTILDIVPIPIIEPAETLEMVGTATGVCTDTMKLEGERGYVTVVNCYYNMNPWCSNTTTPDLFVPQVKYVTDDGGQTIAVPWGELFGGLAYSYSGHAPWTTLVALGIPQASQPKITCTYNP